ncbi:MAG: ROK family protein [Ginsengibacter sp.]
MNNSIAIGVDIGGSHITVALVDLQNQKIIAGSLIRKHINSKGTSDEIIHNWANVIKECSADLPGVSKKIGIAMPGPFNYKEGICLIKDLDKFEDLYNLNVKKLLAKELEITVQNILFMNDASCFLKGEVFGGAAVECNNVMGVTLGTGLGSARFHDGEIFDGDLYTSSFKDGTAEDYLSSRWFIKRYKKLTGITVKNVKELKEKISDDPSIRSLFAEFGHNLGRVLLNHIQKYPFEIVVIGGNIINAWELFFPETKKVLNILPKPIIIRKAKLGEEGALMGAASLWK